jgi:hypothetical protein
LGASQLERIDYDESDALEETDRLLLSALRYWEVQHDLIEERIAAIRSSPFLREKTTSDSKGSKGNTPTAHAPIHDLSRFFEIARVLVRFDHVA